MTYGDDVLSVTFKHIIETTFHQWHTNIAWWWRFVSDVPTLQWWWRFVSGLYTQHGYDVFLVTYQHYMVTCWSVMTNTAFWQRFIIDIPRQHGDDFLSVTYKHSMDTTCYQWRTNTAWWRRFISDALTLHRENVLSVTYQHFMVTTMSITQKLMINFLTGQYKDRVWF